MKKTSFALAIALFAISFAPQALATCTAKGYVIIGPGTYYDHIANGIPDRDECWNPFNASYVTGTTSCGYTASAYSFNYAGSIYQEVTIPSTFTQTNFSADYLVDFEDPNNDAAWNKFTVEVRDLTTNTVLANDYFDGGMGDLYCSRRSIGFTGNLAGHTLRLRITGSKGYSNTNVRVRSIALWQW